MLTIGLSRPCGLMSHMRKMYGTRRATLLVFQLVKVDWCGGPATSPNHTVLRLGAHYCACLVFLAPGTFRWASLADQTVWDGHTCRCSGHQ